MARPRPARREERDEPGITPVAAINDALAELALDVPAAPVSLIDLAAAAPTRAARSALVKEISDRTGVGIRQAQRYVTAATQKRAIPAGRMAAARAVVQARSFDALKATIRREGITFTGPGTTILVSKDERTRDIPTVFITGAQLRNFLEAWDRPEANAGAIQTFYDAVFRAWDRAQGGTIANQFPTVTELEEAPILQLGDHT